MIYREWRSKTGLLRKEWKDESGRLHREDGPAYICHYPDASILQESFYISGVIHRESGPADIFYYPDGSKHEYFYLAGEYLGVNKEGFWSLWGILTEEGRKDHEILKYLVRFS